MLVQNETSVSQTTCLAGVLSDKHKSVYLPNEHSSGQLTGGTFHVLGSDNGIVPVSTSAGLIIVIIHHHTTANHDVSNW